MADRFERLVPPAVAPSAHLDDSELAAVELNNLAAKHLADCAWCMSRRNTMSEEDRDDLAALLAELDAAPVPDDAVKLASDFTMPIALEQFLTADNSSAPTVQPAQVWRLTWHGQDTLGVVLEQDSWWVTVAPVSTDVSLADEYTAVLDAAATSLSARTAVFMRAAATVPQYTLSRYLGVVNPAGVENPARELNRLQKAYLSSGAPPETLETGRPLAYDDWDRQEALDALTEQMRWFEAATLDVLDSNGDIFDPNPDTSTGSRTAKELGQETGRVAQPGMSAEPGAEREMLDVVDALDRSKLSMVELHEGTGIEFGRLLDLKQGDGKPTAEEARLLGEVLEVTVTGRYEDRARLALVMLASQPSNRGLWHRHEHADAGAADEESLRPFLLHWLTEKTAARTVSRSDEEAGHSLEWWLGYWRDRLALRGR